jgi:glycosyltransferase involved in cell wall biosynthesis
LADFPTGDRVPLVTLGVPVRNGAGMLRQALDSIIAQDHPNLEIVVSDNGSTDATPDILRDYADRVPAMRIIRHDAPLTAVDNFMVLVREARGQFFAWCAHDDTRSPNFVSAMLPAFEDPRVVLAFSDLYVWDGRNPPKLHYEYDFDNVGLARWQRLRKTAHMQCMHMYGLWRTEALRAIRYTYTHWWSDMPIMLAAAATSCFQHVQGPHFIYYEVPKTDAQRAVYQDNRARSSRLANLWALLRASFLTTYHTAGIIAAVEATAFLIEKYIRQALRRLRGRREASVVR